MRVGHIRRHRHDQLCGGGSNDETTLLNCDWDCGLPSALMTVRCAIACRKDTLHNRKNDNIGYRVLNVQERRKKMVGGRWQVF